MDPVRNVQVADDEYKNHGDKRTETRTELGCLKWMRCLFQRQESNTPDQRVQNLNLVPVYPGQCFAKKYILYTFGFLVVFQLLLERARPSPGRFSNSL